MTSHPVSGSVTSRFNGTKGLRKATSEALDQLRQILSTATERVRTPNGVSEQPDRSTRRKAGRLLLATAVVIVPELQTSASQAPIDRRTLRLTP